MVQTTELIPAAALRNHIRCYNLRQFDTNGEEMCKALPAAPGIFLSFWLSADPVYFVAGGRVTAVNTRERQLLGMQTGYAGHLSFSGGYQLFGIEFKAGGFHRIFGTEVQAMTNELLEGDAVLGSPLALLQEQLQEAGTLHKLKEFTDRFLLSCLWKNPGIGDCRIDKVVNHIIGGKGLVNMEWLANQANMSFRSFENKFSRQVGLSPKLYSRIIRFNHALALKMAMPAERWTSIAHACGYYDQMHFIKDFKAFAGETPNTFLKQMPTLQEDITVLGAPDL